jgi:regulator of sirC expression with transglutaminase-like and TPR domain
MDAARGARERFAALVGGPDERIDLAEAALLIAAEAYPDLDVSRYLDMLDEIAAGAAPALRACTTDAERVRRLVHYLASERQFRGNENDYYDPRNSFLNDVLERRTGIPITLALVYIEVARRLDLAVVGVGFPGHFLAKHPGPTELIIDPFHGQLVSAAECAERLRVMVGREVPLDASHLRAATPREILVRMLRNLKQIHLQARDPGAALACSERILLVEPDLPPELRDRGLLYAQLEWYPAARADLERFLALAPDDPTAPVIRERLIEIGRKGVTLH